jgi:hypothetical protein
MCQLQSDSELRGILQRKGVYPYSFATSIEALRDAEELPPIDAFYNDLTQEPCSKSEYEYAKHVFDCFCCENMLDYTKLYVESDVYLLADVFINFRNMIWDSFGLDACQYLSLPHMAMDIMLKTTGAEIDHITDQEIADLLKKNIRGGLCYAGLRHAERKEGKQVLLYLDCNNLYGAAQRFPLPMGDLEFMTDEQLENFDPYRVNLSLSLSLSLSFLALIKKFFFTCFARNRKMTTRTATFWKWIWLTQQHCTNGTTPTPWLRNQWGSRKTC